MTSKKFFSFRSFLSYIGLHKLRFSFVIFCFAIANLPLALIPLFIGKLIGALAAVPVQKDQAIVWIVALILCSTGHDILWRVSEYAYMKLITPLSYAYENILFRQIIRKPYPYFVDKFTGKIGSYTTTISSELRGFFDNLCYSYVSHVVSLVTMCIVLSSINWQTGVLFIVCLLIMLLVGTRTIKNSARYEKLSADVQSTKNGKIIDAISNFVNVKSFQKEQDEIRVISLEQSKSIKTAQKSFFWGMVFWGSMSFFVRNIIWPVAIILNVYLFLQGQLSIAQLATVLSSILLFSSFIWEIIWDISQFNLKLARIDEAHKYLFGDTNIIKEYLADVDRDRPKMIFSDVLELNKLNFAYPDKEDIRVLSNINLSILKGEKIGIVGKSGGGKTTLTKLLLGYYPIPENQIMLDRATVETSEVAQLISYVPQDTSLFHRSIAENIAYATDRTVNRNDIVTAAKRAHAHEFISQIAETYDALVGERGVKLSAGQRQRIAIARAYLDDKPILILDEATSALDSESEILVQEALESLWEDKTVIAIAHRLSTLRRMDRIIVMNDGKIVEQGSHEELIKYNGIYAKLWSHQSGGFIED